MTEGPRIERIVPAPPERAAELHERLADAGQALREDETTTFFLAATGPEGALEGACKGEIAFRSAHVSELWVNADLRGRGLGRKLLAEAEALAKERGCDRLHLETRNPKARRLYERLGYRVFGELPRYDGDAPFCYLSKEFA